MGFHFFDSNNSTNSCQANDLTYSPQTSASRHSEACDHWSSYPPQREAFSRSTGNERFLTLIPALNRPSVWNFTENNRYLWKSLIIERSTMQSRFAPTPKSLPPEIATIPKSLPSRNRYHPEIAAIPKSLPSRNRYHPEIATIPKIAPIPKSLPSRNHPEIATIPKSLPSRNRYHPEIATIRPLCLPLKP